MVSNLINDWLEEAIIGSSQTKIEVRRKKTTIPIVTNDKGDIQTSKPLFSLFMDETQLEPDFLPTDLANIEKQFRNVTTINIDQYFEKVADHESPKKECFEEKGLPIEYDRKNIFLSRVMHNLFEMPDSSVLKGSIEYSKVLERNEFYQDALERHSKFPENFKEQNIQTDFIDTVEKQLETMPMIFENKNCMINNYLLKEHYERGEMEVKSPPKTFTEFFNLKTKFCDYKEFLLNIRNNSKLLASIQNALYVTEKTLNYNSYKISILDYNGCSTDLESIITESTAIDIHEESVNEVDNVQSVEQLNIKHHLRFYLEYLKHDYKVTCMECSPVNPSIFVAGYGVSRLKEMDYDPRGIILFWNIHKCGYPEKTYYTEEIVTCLEFSKAEPYLVAVGMRYGLIEIFDLRKSEKYSVNNYSSKVRPIETITHIRWVNGKYAMEKELLSVSMDGLICSWTCGKELDGLIMRYVKRGGSISEEEQRLVVAIDAAGMCMQFKPDSNNVFVIGTIEGEALQVDINDPDSYMHTYKCHNGPLYDLKWSPLVKNVFMTSGTDRLIHIWEEGRKKPPKSLMLEDVVLLVSWSSVKSTLFAAMCKTRILIFDLSIDLHKEIAEYSATDNLMFTFLNFCPRNNWILVGYSDGSVALYELMNVPDSSVEQEEALRNTFLADY